MTNEKLTKENTINFLKQVNKILINDNSWLERTHEPLNQAFDMAIKALEQQPSEDKVSVEVYKQVTSERDIAIEQLKELGYEFGEKIRTSDDCVSREQALLSLTGENLSSMNAEELIVLFNKRIKALPLVTPTRKVGKWIEHNQTTVDGSRDYIECSCCKIWFGKWEMPRNSYCPNCGAEMRGDETKYDCVKCKHDGFICDECENGSKYEEMRGSENEVN